VSSFSNKFSGVVKFPPWKFWCSKPKEGEVMPKEMKPRGKRGVYYAHCRHMGETLYECLGTTDEKLARRRLEHLKALVERGEYQVWKRKFSDLAEIYLSEILPKKTEDCQRRYESIVRVHLMPFFGGKRIADIVNCNSGTGDNLVKLFFDEKIDLPESSLKKMARVLRDILRIGDKSFKLPAIIYRNKGFYQKRYMTDLELSNVVQCLDEKFYAICLLMAHTGLRLSNAAGLTWNNIRLGQEMVEVKQSKTGDFVKIPFTRTVSDVFKFKSRIRSIGDSKLFQFKGYSFQRGWNKAVGKAGLDWKPRVHDLRHYFCSYLLNRGVDHITVATLSGHKDVNILKERYGHLTDDTLKQAISVFDNLPCEQSVGK
jgi:integrase